MKILFAALACVLSTLAWFAPMKGAKADPIVWGDFFQFQCVPELDVMELRAISVRGQKAQTAADRPDQHLQPRHNIFSPRWYYSTGSEEDRNDLARVPNETNDFVREPARFSCALSTGLAELVILPEPLVVFIVSGGEWWKPTGDDIQSISVSFRIDGRLILDDIPFHRCEDNAGISKLLYNAAEGRFELFGWFGFLPGQSQPPSEEDGHASTIIEFLIGPDYITVPRPAEPPALPSTIRLGPLTGEDVYNPPRTSEPDPDQDGYACQYYGVDYLSPHRPAIRLNAPPPEPKFPG